MIREELGEAIREEKKGRGKKRRGEGKEWQQGEEERMGRGWLGKEKGEEKERGGEEL